MKIVINTCHGCFAVSKQAITLYNERTGSINIWGLDVSRNDPILVEIVEQLGEAVNGTFSKLKVVEIPDDVDWIIKEYDGKEWIAEKHRTWN